MIITTISAVQPPTPAAPDDWRTQLGQVLVKVQTDSGVCGFGVGGGGSASIHVIETVLSDLLVGQDPSEVEQLHNQMCCHTAFYGRKGLVVMAISGVDLALWDIRGKVNETSVAKLLNTNVDFDLPIPTYTTVSDDEQAKTAIEAGDQAIKLHVERFGDRPSPAEIGSLVNRTRNQLGADAQIMVDAFARWDLDTTLRVADEIVPHGVTPPEQLLLVPIGYFVPLIGLSQLNFILVLASILLLSLSSLINFHLSFSFLTLNIDPPTDFISLSI